MNPPVKLPNPFAEIDRILDLRECAPSFTLEKHIASLRDENPERWAELQKEWKQP